MAIKQQMGWLPLNQVPIPGLSDCFWEYGRYTVLPILLGYPWTGHDKGRVFGLQTSAWSNESSKLLMNSNERIKEIISLIKIKVDFCLYTVTKFFYNLSFQWHDLIESYHFNTKCFSTSLVWLFLTPYILPLKKTWWLRT